MGVGVSAFIYVYDYYARLTDEKLRAGPFSNTSLLYAAARPVMTGEDAKLEEIADYLRRCGYSESSNNRLGWFHLRADAIEVNPGPDSFDSEGAVIKIRGGKITEIISERDQSQRNLYQLEPELMTNLFDKKREKRRIVHFNDIPTSPKRWSTRCWRPKTNISSHTPDSIRWASSARRIKMSPSIAWKARPRYPCSWRVAFG
jgi:penicillin-binding protein 1B